MKEHIKIIISYRSLRRRMMNEPYFYNERQVSHTVWKLLGMDKEILEAFVVWFEDGVEPNLEFSDISWDKLVHRLFFNEFNAFIFINYVKHNPQKAWFDLVQGKGKDLTIDINKLRPELRSFVKEKQREISSMEKENGKTFTDSDTIEINMEKGFTVKLNKK